MAKVISTDSGRMGRVPPQNIEAERSVLGAMMLDNEARYKALEILDPEHFYTGAHAIIFETIAELFEGKGSPADLVVVTNRLREKGKLENIGGPGYLAGLVNVVPTVENAEHYAKIVRNKAILRACIKVADRMADACYREELEPDEILERASGEFLDLSKMREERDFATMNVLADQAYGTIKRLSEKGPDFLSTPFGEFNEKFHGFQPGEYVIIAARPSVGKTSFALNIANHVAGSLGKSVAIFTLEMSSEQLAIRIIAALSRISADAINAGQIKDKEKMEAIRNTVSIIKSWKVSLDDSPSLTALSIRAKIKRLLLESSQDIDLIIIDYLQLLDVETGRRSENRVQEVSQLSRSLKALSREVNKPILVLSQLSRHIERRDFKQREPMLSDLRESGAIEQDADKVIFLQRVSEAQEIKGDTFEFGGVDYPTSVHKDGMEIIPIYVYLAKNRNGPTGQLLLGFTKDIMKFGPYWHSGGTASTYDRGTVRVEERF